MWHMARFLLTAMPFTGHVRPLLAVAESLADRGHGVRFYSGSAFEAPATAAGVRFVPWTSAPDFDENDLQATFPRLIGRKGLRQVFINLEDVMIGTAPAQVADLTAEWARAPWDALIADETSVGGALAAESIGCRWATVAVLPLHMAGTQGPPPGLGLTPGTNALTRARDALLRAAVPLLARPLQGPLGRARSAVGLGPSRLTFEKALMSPHLVLASGGPLLDFDRSDRPPHLHFVGELARSRAAEFAPPPWWGDLDGRRVVLVTQGTQNIEPSDLLQPTLEALADEDVLVVATTGIPGRDDLPFPVPGNARVAGFIPYPHLLPRVDVIVTNGGWGGTVAALAHGIPLVIGGGDLDKPEVAARVAWSGAGVNLKTGTPSPAQVAAGVARVLAEPSFRQAAERVGAQLRSLGGASRAAELLGELP